MWKCDSVSHATISGGRLFDDFEVSEVYFTGIGALLKHLVNCLRAAVLQAFILLSFVL